MTKKSCTVWINDMSAYPKIEGNLEISKNSNGIFIGGDPRALRSLAQLLTWMANVDQNSLPHQPDGERFHVHLHAKGAEGFNSLTPFSVETELCRLDAKGTGDLPEKYHKLKRANVIKENRTETRVKHKKVRRARKKDQNI